MTRERVGTLAAALLLGLFAVVALGRASASQAEDRVRAEMRDSVAFAVASAIAPLRKVAAEAEARRVAAEDKLATVRQSGRAALEASHMATISNMAVLSDSAATVPQLRGALVVQVATTERVVAEFHAYLAADAVAHATADSARFAERAVLAQTVDALKSMTQARDAWRSAATCRVWLVKCPTRTQAAIGGALLGFTAWRVLR